MNDERRVLLYAPATGRASRLAVALPELRDRCPEGIELLLIGHVTEAEALRAAAESWRASGQPCHLLLNPIAQGPGADHKLALQLAIEQGFAAAAPLDDEAGFSVERLCRLLDVLIDEGADAAFGAPADEGAGAASSVDRLLAWLQRRLVGVELSAFRTRYRLYAVASLRRVRFDLATDEAHFDVDLLVQLDRAGARLVEVPLPALPTRRPRPPGTWGALRSLFRAWLCEKDLFYDRRFDRASGRTHDVYRLKLDFDSSHTAALARVPQHTRVLDLGCGNPSLARQLAERRGCRITGIDRRPAAGESGLEAFHVHDLDRWPLPVSPADYDVVLLLDVLEHLASPEAFVDHLRDELTARPETRLVVSVPNVAFFVERIMLLLGRFHYGRRGVLDLTHTRLFTVASIRRLFEQSGFVVEEVHGVPPPYPLAIGLNPASRFLLRLNRLLIRLSIGLFAYQVMLVVRASPSPRVLLDRAAEAAARHECTVRC